MKNVLFATTALVSVAGAAFADGHAGVALSGAAEMGITYFDDGTDDTVVFHNDIDVTFTLSGATDNGLTFGASIDLDEAGDNDGAPTTLNGTSIEFENSVFISGDFGTLSMGDVDGAYDQALSGIHAGGLSDEADQASGTSGFDGLAPEILRYDYSFGAITASASLALEDQVNINDESGGVSNVALDDNVYAIGINYNGDLGGFTLNAGVGAQFTSTNDAGGAGDGDHTVIGGSAVLGFGDFEVIAVIESYDRPSDSTLFADGEVYGISAAYTAGAIEVALGYERDDRGTERDLIQAYVTYDLTGGAELVGAISYAEDNAGLEETRAGFGIGLAF